MAREAPTADADEQTTTPDPESSGGNRFFTWIRALDLPRQPGWIGGVCAGIAARLGIDPLIVRGIVVVIAVLGGPAFLLYAAGWLLLPDTKDKIHLEQLLKGRLESPLAGIGVLVLLSLLPVTQGFWYAGAAYWGQPYWGEAVGRALWTAAVLGVIVWFVVWIARRAARAGTAPTVSPATTDNRPDTIPEPLRQDAAGIAGAPAVAPPAAAPPAPGADAPPEELAAWREQQAAWKAEREEFRRQQAATARELGRQRAEEARARSAEAATERAERRRVHRLANPRLSGAAVAVVLGLAIVLAGVAAFLASGSATWDGRESVTALAVATLVVGVSLVVAGALRRRSGFLGFLALVLVVATIATSFLPDDRRLLPSAHSQQLDESGRFAQPFGYFSLIARPGELEPDGAVIDLWQGSGQVYLNIPDDLTVLVEARLKTGRLLEHTFTAVEGGYDSVTRVYDPAPAPNGEHAYRVTIGPEGPPDAIVRIWQGAGEVWVQREPAPKDPVKEPAEKEPAPKGPEPTSIEGGQR